MKAFKKQMTTDKYNIFNDTSLILFVMQYFWLKFQTDVQLMSATFEFHMNFDLGDLLFLLFLLFSFCDIPLCAAAAPCCLQGALLLLGCPVCLCGVLPLHIRIVSSLMSLLLLHSPLCLQGLLLLLYAPLVSLQEVFLHCSHMLCDHADGVADLLRCFGVTHSNVHRGGDGNSHVLEVERKWFKILTLFWNILKFECQLKESNITPADNFNQKQLLNPHKHTINEFCCLSLLVLSLKGTGGT